jgi:RNA polymerase sigma-70 factor, ECF subfamily
LFQIIRPLARNNHDTEDILQNVLVKVIKNGEQVSAASFLPWLQTVCRTTSIDYYRKNKSKHSQLDEEKDGPVVESENESAISLSKCVRPLLKNLNEEDYKILKAVELDGMAQNELAEKMDINYSALKSKVQRARKKLKEEILQCCSIELDNRNSPIDFTPKKKMDCC